MAFRGPGPGVWLWRWRRNPLKRRADAVEAWVVLGVWLLTLAAGVLAGWAGVRGVRHGLDQERSEWRSTVALVTRKAPGAASAAETDDDGARDAGTGHGPGGAPSSVWGEVRWTAPDGTARTGRTRVASDSAVGAAVTVWTDRRGRLVTRPPTVNQARTRSLVIGGLVGMTAAAVPLACGRLLRERLERRRLDGWDVEWARFDPLWGRETR
ncbi:Rv1733c family protein [Streptomyces seoulensis]